MVVNSWRWHRPNLVLAASFFLAFIATFAGAAPAASASDTQSTQVIPPGLEISPEEVEKLNEILGISAPVLPGAGLETSANGAVGPYRITAFSDGVEVWIEWRPVSDGAPLAEPAERADLTLELADGVSHTSEQSLYTASDDPVILLFVVAGGTQSDLADSIAFAEDQSRSLAGEGVRVQIGHLTPAFERIGDITDTTDEAAIAALFEEVRATVKQTSVPDDRLPEAFGYLMQARPTPLSRRALIAPLAAFPGDADDYKGLSKIAFDNGIAVFPVVSDSAASDDKFQLDQQAAGETGGRVIDLSILQGGSSRASDAAFADFFGGGTTVFTLTGQDAYRLPWDKRLSVDITGQLKDAQDPPTVFTLKRDLELVHGAGIAPLVLNPVHSVQWFSRGDRMVPAIVVLLVWLSVLALILIGLVRVLNPKPKAFLFNTESGETVPVKRFPLTVGRSGQSDIVIDNETVSREHVVIELGPDGQARIRDLGSLNGTWIRGERILTSALRSSEMVLLGSARIRIIDAP